MPRARDPNRDKAFEIFKEHNGNITNRKIAEILDCPEKTISAWKSRDKWNAVLQTNDCSTTNESKVKKKTKKQAAESLEAPLNENGELNDKQWLFCMYYTKYWNATKAYQKAYEAPYNQGRANGARLIAKDSIRAEINRMKKDISQGIMIDARVVLQKYIDIAFSDIGDFVEFDKYSVRMKDLQEVDTSVLTEASNTEEGVKLKLADKMKALDFLAKYTDLLNDNELKQLKIEKERMAISKMSGENSGSQESEVAKMLRKLAGDE